MQDEQIQGVVLNVKFMAIHAAAFGLFASCALVYAVFYGWYLLNISDKSSNVANGVEFLMYLFSFIAQCLLCQIFVMLGTKHKFRQTLSAYSQSII